MAAAPAPTVHDMAIQAAGHLATFSGAYPFTPNGVSKTSSVLATTTPLPMRLSLLMDTSTTNQWLVVCGAQVVVLTRPMVATNAAGDCIILASLGDSMIQAVPVSIPHSVISSGVIALVSEDDHTALNLPGCNSIPGLLDPPPRADGANSNEQAGLARLHYDDAIVGSGDAPVFGVLPLAFPLARGETPVLQELSEPFPATGNHSSAAKVWFQAMAYLSSHNSGTSLHAFPGLFTPDDCSQQLFPNATLVGPISVAVTTLPALSPHFANVTVVHREAAQGALLAHAAALPVPAAASTTAAIPGAAAPFTGPAFSAALAAAISPLVTTLAAGNKAATTATTQSEREHQTDIKAVEARYKLAWGQVVTTIDPVTNASTESVVFPKLSDALLAVLTPSKVAKAEVSFQESATSFLASKARSTNYYDGTTDWNCKSFGIPGISCLRDFSFATVPPTLNHDEIKDKLSIFHFARADHGCVFYKARQIDEHLISRQYRVGEDTTKLKRKVTDLYWHGVLLTVSDLKIAICNFHSFCSWAFPDFATNPPALWTALNELVFTLNTPMGRVWSDQHKALPHVSLHLFIAVQHMLGPFIALGNVMEYRNAVLLGTPVAVAAYKEASAFAILQVRKVNNIIHQGDLGTFAAAPSIMRLFYPDSTTPSVPNYNPASGTGSVISDLTNPVPRKDASSRSTSSQSSNQSSQGSNAPNAPDLTAARASGVMKRNTKSGKPPVPRSLMSHPLSGKMTYLCGNASTVGYACIRDAESCNFIHALKLQDLKRPADRVTLKNFIANHVELSLANPGT